MNDLRAESTVNRGRGYPGSGRKLARRGRLRRRCKHNGLRRNQTLTLLHRDELIWLDVRDRVFPAAGPDDPQTHGLAVLRFAQAESNWQLALGEIAGAILDHRKLAYALVCLQRNFGPNTITV